jgi:hypothetical protein
MADIRNKTASIYIDDTAAQTALQNLQQKADGLNKTIDDTRKKQKALTDEIARAKDAGENYSKQQQQLSKLNTELGKTEKALQGNVTQQKALAQQIDSKVGPSLKQQQVLVSKLVNEYKNLGANSEAAANKLKQIGEQTKVLNTLKDRLSAVQKVQQEATSHGRGFGEIFTKVAEYSGAFAIIQKGTDLVRNFMEGTIEEADQALEAVDNLKVALENAGRSDLLEPLLKQADEFAAKYKRLDNDDITGVFTKLIDYGKLTEKQIKEVTEVIINYAAKQRISLGEATDVVTKALEGSAKGLKIYGINLSEAKTVTERYNIVVDQLGKKVEGAEAAFEQTPKGIREKFTQAIRDAQEAVGKFLYSLAGIEEQAHRNAISAKQEATQGQALVDEYEQLSKKVNKTTAEKERLKTITSDLVSIFGTSVVSINKETGALELNVQATKDLIKQKLLLANDDAAKAAAKYNKALNDVNDAVTQVGILTSQIDTKQKQLGETLDEVETKAKKANASLFSGKNQLSDPEVAFRNLNKQLDAQKDKLKDGAASMDKYEKQLTELGFTANDVKKLLNPEPVVNPNGVIGLGNPNANTEADKKAENDRNKILEDQKKFLEELRKLNVEYGLLNESDKDREIQQVIEKYNALRAEAHGNAELLKKEEESLGNAILQVRQKFAQKELEEQIKQDDEKEKKRQAFIDKQLKEGTDRLNRIAKEVQDNAAIANERRLDQLKLDELKAHGKKRLDAELAILNEEEQQELNKKDVTEEKKALIEEQYRQKRRDAEIQFWAGLFQQLLSFGQSVSEIFSLSAQVRTNKEQAQLQQEKKNNDDRKKSYDTLLNRKVISQQQFNQKQAEADDAYNKKAAALKKKEWIRQQKADVIGAEISTAQAILSALTTQPFWLGLILAGVAAVKGGEQVKEIKSRPVPEFEKGGALTGPRHSEGGMPVINPRTGRKEAEVEGGEVILSRKTVAKNKPVVDALLYNSMYKQGATIDPWFKNRTYKSIDFSGISKSIQNVRHYESGGVFTTSDGKQQPANTTQIIIPPGLEVLPDVLNALITQLQTPQKNYVVWQEIKDKQNTEKALLADATFGKKS